MRCITKVVDVGEEEKELQLWLIIVNGRLSVFWIFSNLSSAGQGPLAGLILSHHSILQKNCVLLVVTYFK